MWSGDPGVEQWKALDHQLAPPSICFVTLAFEETFRRGDHGLWGMIGVDGFGGGEASARSRRM
jgi:hypothetical protein